MFSAMFKCLVILRTQDMFAYKPEFNSLCYFLTCQIIFIVFTAKNILTFIFVIFIVTFGNLFENVQIFL